MLGDVVGPSGCARVAAMLPTLKARYGADMVIANGENSAEGNGITPQSFKQLLDAGVDVVTGGNHILRRRQIYDKLDEKAGLIRPANYHKSAPGAGHYIFDHPRFPVCVINLQGVVYMQNLQSPFDRADELLTALSLSAKIIVVDFHAEATAEKICLGHYLDGRVSAVLGTHTHVPTADARILPNGTAYCTDVGMCGGLNSVLGVEKSLAVLRMRTALPVKFETDAADVRLSGVMLDIDEKTGKCREIEQFLDCDGARLTFPLFRHIMILKLRFCFGARCDSSPAVMRQQKPTSPRAKADGVRLPDRR
jgi:metallophosphoesterase (TIGR00282 family)